MVENTLLAAGWLATKTYVPLKWQLACLLIGEIILIAISLFLALFFSSWMLRPLEFIWRSVTALSPTTRDVAPDADKLKLGRELVANLTRQIYQLASAGGTAEKPATGTGKLDFISLNLPLPLFVIDEENRIKFVNAAGGKYIEGQPKELIDKDLYDILDMSFPSEDTFDAWLKSSRENSATAQKTWSRVKLSAPEGEQERQFELVAYYNKSNAQHYETILVLFDQTEHFSSDDDQASFVALAVHELRNPLTMLRGYIEVLEEEVDDNTNLELTTDLQKMRSSAKLLTEYTNNILNVSRLDSDQLSLHLNSENWESIVKDVVESMRLRAQVHGLKFDVKINRDLPPVGVDRVSMSEVLTNLIDNAIKYSKGDKPIEITSRLTSDGEVETIVKDFGVVIGADVVGNLFQKFYRNHRSRSQVGGTGLGLYLSKAFVEAHGGNIWVKSSESEGTMFGFTVLPYDRVQDKSDGSQGITRVPHGWVKNHSLYRP